MLPVQNRTPSGGAANPPGPTQPPIPAGGPGGPPPAPGGRRPLRVPPQMQQHVDGNNPIQAEILQRIDVLSPQDIMAFANGISPAAVAVLKKVLPELGFLLDRIGKGGAGAAPGGAPAPALPPGGGPVNGPSPPSPAPMAAGPGAMPRPQTKLGSF